MTLGERLQTAVDAKYENAHQFQGDMAKRGVKGSAYPSIYSYLKGKSAPSLEFLQEAAELLGVRLMWLAFGEGEPTEEAAAPRRVGLLSEDEFWAREEALIASLDLGDDDRQYSRRNALLRFDRTLSDAQLPRTPWTASWETREALLRGAGRFLVAVDDAVDLAAQRDGEPAEGGAFWDELILRRSASTPWNVLWYDAVLALFARRVRGLGIRAGGWGEAHERRSVSMGPTPAEE